MIPYKTAPDNEISVCCPFCGDTKYKLYYNKLKRVYHCKRAGCGKSGNYWTLPREYRRFFDSLGIETVEAEIPAPFLPEGFMSVVDGMHNSFFLDYLNARGVSNEIAEELNFGYTMKGKYAYRIIIPTLFEKELVGFEARDIKGKGPKSLWGTGDRSSVIANIDRLRSKEVYIVEGVFDAIQIGLDRSVWVFGSHLTPQQVGLLKALNKNLLILFDHDARGKAFEAARALSTRKKQTRVVDLPGEDPDKWIRGGGSVEELKVLDPGYNSQIC